VCACVYLLTTLIQQSYLSLPIFELVYDAKYAKLLITRGKIMTFTIGDKIRCIEDGNLYGELHLGDIYTIKMIAVDMVILKERTTTMHKNQLFSIERFEKVTN
jgi:hypothetical protein